MEAGRWPLAAPHACDAIQNGELGTRVSARVESVDRCYCVSVAYIGQ
jgi:hypothetical protein